MEPDEQEALITLRQLDPEIELAYDLVEQFAQMLRTRTGERLDAWLERARASQIRELQGFATSVERDKAAVVAAYGKLKALLVKKFGGKSDVVQAVEQVEAKPDSNGRKETLAEEIAEVKANQDPEIVQAAQILLQAVQGLPEGGQHMQTATGNYIAQADRGSTASVNVGQLRHLKEL